MSDKPAPRELEYSLYEVGVAPWRVQHQPPLRTPQRIIKMLEIFLLVAIFALALTAAAVVVAGAAARVLLGR